MFSLPVHAIETQEITDETAMEIDCAAIDFKGHTTKRSRNNKIGLSQLLG